MRMPMGALSSTPKKGARVSCQRRQLYNCHGGGLHEVRHELMLLLVLVLQGRRPAGRSTLRSIAAACSPQRAGPRSVIFDHHQALSTESNAGVWGPKAPVVFCWLNLVFTLVLSPLRDPASPLIISLGRSLPGLCPMGGKSYCRAVLRHPQGRKCGFTIQCPMAEYSRALIRPHLQIGGAFLGRTPFPVCRFDGQIPRRLASNERRVSSFPV